MADLAELAELAELSRYGRLGWIGWVGRVVRRETQLLLISKSKKKRDVNSKYQSFLNDNYQEFPRAVHAYRQCKFDIGCARRAGNKCHRRI